MRPGRTGKVAAPWRPSRLCFLFRRRKAKKKGRPKSSRLSGNTHAFSTQPAPAVLLFMLLRNRNGASLFSQFRRRVSCYGPRSPHLSLTPTTVTPAPSLCRHQLRVLRTSATRLPPASTVALLNWSTAAHRMRHTSPSIMTSSAKTQSRGHIGHSHHHGAHDNSYLVSANKKDAGVRITRIGLYVNLGMAIGKGFGGYVFNSQGETQQHYLD